MKVNKKMLGDKIYRLRKKKGMSQAELGELVGVSNKAVSKWETDEANPEISLLPLLAKVLGVTVDELLNDCEAKKIENQDDSDSHDNNDNNKESTFFGIRGTTVRKIDRFEFISEKKTKKGVPYLHINLGRSLSTINSKARGLIAIGNNAKGLISIGLISVGLISIGFLALGLLAIGTFAIGLAAFATVALGGVSFGAVAVGVIAFGGIAIGYAAFGGIAIGYYAHTSQWGIAIGKHIIIHHIS